HPLADSYTQALGVRTATLVLSGVIVTVSALTMVTTVVVADRMPPWVLAAAVAGLSLTLGALSQFHRRPAPPAAKRVEAGVGVSILAMHGALLMSVLHARSISWR